MAERFPNPVHWIASSYKDFREFPEAVQDAMGYALYQAQIGEKHASEALEGIRRGRGSGNCLRAHRRYISHGLYREIYTRGLCVARISEKVEVGKQNAERRFGADTAAPEGR